jgi:hypothetical protein
MATPFLNLETLGDVEDLTRNYDRWIPILRQRFTTIQSAWTAVNAADANQFDSDLTALERRWALAHTLAVADKTGDIAAIPIIAWSLPVALSILYAKLHGQDASRAIPAETVYNAYLSALQQKATSATDQGQISPGDYIDLVERLGNEENVLGMPAPQNLRDPSVIQPGWDESLQALKDGEKAQDVVGLITTFAVIGLAILAFNALKGNTVVVKESDHE